MCHYWQWHFKYILTFTEYHFIAFVVRVSGQFMHVPENSYSKPLFYKDIKSDARFLDASRATYVTESENQAELDLSLS